MLSDSEVKELELLCKENRRNIIDMVYSAQSGHIGGSLSACEILTVLYHKCMKHVIDWKNSPDFEKIKVFIKQYNSKIEILCKKVPLTDIGGAVLL